MVKQNVQMTDIVSSVPTARTPWKRGANAVEMHCKHQKRRASTVKILRSCKSFESPAGTPQKRGKTHGELRSNTIRAW